MKEEIKKHIEDILKELGVENPKVNLEPTAYVDKGDYTTNVAMVYSKKLGKKPTDLAEEIRGFVEVKLPQIKIQVVAPGFINFFFDVGYFGNVVKTIVSEKENFGKNDSLKGQKIIIEYTDPNPFKEFHIGHLMSNSIGESISRIIESQGAEIKRLSYGGDVGLHVAKAIFGVLARKDEIDEIKNESQKAQLSFWAQCYVFGNTRYDENEKSKKEIDDLNKTIFEKNDKEINDLYDWGRKVSVEHFQEMFKRLDTHFDKNIWESDVLETAMKTVNTGLEKNILENSDGAVVFKGENYGLHTRVFVNSKGLPTYEAKELGLGIKKYEMFKFDKSIVITGNEQNEYFKVVLKAMELFKPEVSNKTVHIGHGMLRFASGKMSSRLGNVITAVSLIDDVKNLVLEKMKEREMEEDEKEEVAEEVAVGALRYSILKQTAGKDIIFDIENSISFEGDSGPYLQYATVRANSILKKALNLPVGRSGEHLLKANVLAEKIPENWQTTNLERFLERFPAVVERAGVEYAPSYIATYLIELAGEFNSFYASHKIIDEADVTSPYRLALTRGFVCVMTSGLNLLGIKVPKQM